MEIRLAYGETGVTLDVPDTVKVDRYGLTTVNQPVTAEQFERRLKETGGMDYLAGTPLVLVNDGFRATPTARVLSWIDGIDHAFLDRARFLIATGSHAEPVDSHLETIFGPHLSRVRGRLYFHSARDREAMRQIGMDEFDFPVWLNELALEAEKIIIIGSVEPHYFAGYTGGRKALFPGVCDLATIERNHNMANSLEAQPLRLKGNPVAEHLDRLLDLVNLSNIYSIQVVMDAGKRLDSVHCGDIRESFTTAVEAAAGLYSQEVEGAYDLILAEIRPPLDRNLYQAQKALENTQGAVRDGGTVVVVSACKDGVGSEHFFDLADRWDREKNQAVDGVPRFGSHKLSRVNLMTRRIDVRIHCTVPPADVRRVFYEPVEDLQSFLNETVKPGSRMAVVYDAGHTVLHRK